MAADCLRYSSLEKCILAAGGLWFACGLPGDAAPADIREIWSYENVLFVEGVTEIDILKILK